MKTSKKFVDHISEFIKFINVNQLQNKVMVVKTKGYNIGHPLYGKKVVLTGFRNKDFEKALKHIGVTLSTSVSKNTYYLIYNEKNNSSKMVKANNLNIKTIQLNEFIHKYIN